MADSSLRDVIKSIKVEGAERANADERTHELLLAIDKRFADYFEELRRGKLDALEDRLEKKKNKAKAGTSKPGKGPEADLGFLSGLGLGALGTALTSLANIAGTFAGLTAGFVAATEGLGVYKKDIEKFKTAMKGFMKPITSLTRLVDNTTASLLRGLGLMDDVDAGDPRKAGAASTLADKARARWNKFKLGLLNSLGIGPDGKAIQLRGPNGQFGPKSEFGKKLQSALEKFNTIFDKLKEFGKSIGSYFANAKDSAGNKIIDTLKNFRPIAIAARILRPLAAIFSVFDGVRKAEAEMADREGFFDKYLGGGLGGFVSGALASFFGEFFDFIKDIPTALLKYVVPKEWINQETGEFNEAAGILPSLLGKYENFSFANIISEAVQKPFDYVAAGLDYLKNLLGFGSEDENTKAKEEFTKWWNQTSWGQKGLDIVGTIIDIAFSPITAIINEIERVFLNADADQLKTESFTDKVAKFVNWFSNWFDNLIPSKDDIMRAVALAIGDNKVSQALGLGEYFKTDAERIQLKETALADIFENYQDLKSQGGWAAESAKYLIDQIMDAQRELNEVRQLQGMNPIQIFNTDNSQTSNGGGTAVVVEGTFSSADISNQLRANGILGANP